MIQIIELVDNVINQDRINLTSAADLLDDMMVAVSLNAEPGAFGTLYRAWLYLTNPRAHAHHHHIAAADVISRCADLAAADEDPTGERILYRAWLYLVSPKEHAIAHARQQYTINQILDRI